MDYDCTAELVAGYTIQDETKALIKYAKWLGSYTGNLELHGGSAMIRRAIIIRVIQVMRKITPMLIGIEFDALLQEFNEETVLVDGVRVCQHEAY